MMRQQHFSHYPSVTVKQPVTIVMQEKSLTDMKNPFDKLHSFAPFGLR